MFAIKSSSAHRPRPRGGQAHHTTRSGRQWDNPTPARPQAHASRLPRPPFSLPYTPRALPHKPMAHVRRPDDGLDRPPLPLLSPPADPEHPAVHRNGERRRHHPRGHRAPPALQFGLPSPWLRAWWRRWQHGTCLPYGFGRATCLTVTEKMRPYVCSRVHRLMLRICTF